MRTGILAVGAATVAAVAIGVFVAAGSSGANAQAKRLPPLDTGPSASAQPWKRYPGWPAADYSKFNTLGKLASAPAPTEPRKLTGPIEGDAANGGKLVADRARGGSCLACHVMGPAGNADLPGNVAPDLSEIGNAGREDEWLYNYVFDARVYNPETVMPPWGSHGLFSETEIRDIVAYLKTLKSPAVFRTALDNPDKRPQPIEKRDNLDPLENPGMWAVDKGQELWKLKTSAGFSCNTCHSDAATSFKTWAASMPKWEPRLSKVLGVEEFVTRHTKATTGAEWLMETDNNRAMSVYLNFLANGTPIKLDTESAESKAALARGVELSKRKVGVLNLACTDCHGIAVNKWIRGQWMGEPKGQADHFPTWRTSLQTIWDIRQRFQWCSVNIRGDELPPDSKEYGDLELYVKSQSEGLKMNVPGIRH